MNLRLQYQHIQNEIDSTIDQILEDGHFILGPKVSEFEEMLADYCNCSFAVGVASGTDALLLSMIAHGICSDDEVITSPFTFVSTANTVTRLGAKPIFVDIEPTSYNIDVNQVEEKITQKTKAIIPVHLFGQPANMDPIMRLADEYGLIVIEDASQSIGASYRGHKVGSLGASGTFSFFPTKNLGAYGDGGAIVTNIHEVAEKVALLRQQGARKQYYHEILGFNSRLDALQAAILKVKLKHLDMWNNKRRHIASTYNHLLQGLNLVLPREAANVYHVYHQYTIQLPLKIPRQEFEGYLSKMGIETRIYYPYCLHLQPVFEYLGYKQGEFPVCEQTCQRVISLPCCPELSKDEQSYICETIIDFLSARQ